MPNDPATQQSPAAKPVAAPNRGAGLGPRNAANTAAPISARTNVTPSVLAGLAARAFSSVTPDSRIHARAKSTGEYQTAPSTRLDKPAASTAHTFISGIRYLRLAAVRSD